jgi:chromatin structure-remodeling complex protein RSC7
MNGVYEIHTNLMHYPGMTQPTHAKWEQIAYDPDSVSDAEQHLEGINIRNASVDLPNGVNGHGDAARRNSTPYNATDTCNETSQNNIDKEPMATNPAPSSRPAFSTPTSYQLRNFATVDTQFVYPRYTGLGRPGWDVSARVLPGEGSGLASVPPEIADLLPLECRAAFDEAKNDEIEWKSSWGTEKQDGLRVDPRVTFCG